MSWTSIVVSAFLVAFLALLGSLATAYLLRWQRRRDTRRVIFLELEDLRGTLATVVFVIRSRTGTLDVKSMRWFIPSALDHKSPESPPQAWLESSAASTDAELQNDIDSFNATQKGKGINLKTHHL